MRTDTAERRPRHEGDAPEDHRATATSSTVADPANIGVRRRHRAALRSEPLDDGVRDPLARVRPMTEAQLREYANRLVTEFGFSVDYVRHRLGIEPRRACCSCCGEGT